MAKEYCIDLYVSICYPWMQNYGFKRKSNRNGTYYSAIVGDAGKKEIEKLAKGYHIYYSCYEKRWSRSSTYRDRFLKEVKGPYRCRYCNRKISKDYMMVDHIVPVDRAKRSKIARFLLKVQNISDVNEIKNLAPSCRKCNNKKSNKMGLWFIRGILGKYKLYWTVIYILLFILCVAAIYGIYNLSIMDFFGR